MGWGSWNCAELWCPVEKAIQNVNLDAVLVLGCNSIEFATKRLAGQTKSGTYTNFIVYFVLNTVSMNCLKSQTLESMLFRVRSPRSVDTGILDVCMQSSLCGPRSNWSIFGRLVLSSLYLISHSICCCWWTNIAECNVFILRLSHTASPEWSTCFLWCFIELISPMKCSAQIVYRIIRAQFTIKIKVWNHNTFTP